MKRLFTLACMVLSIGFLVACTNESADGASENNNETAEEEREPVELLLGFPHSDDDFEEMFKEPIEDALPHITLNNIPLDTWDQERLELSISEGARPDILWVSLNHHAHIVENFGLMYDMSELIEASNFDLSRLRENTLEGIEIYSRDGEINMLPINTGAYTLVYNKGIFDQFGESYPDDHMTYDEILDLAQRLTREEEGDIYRGLDLGWAHTNVFEFDFEYVDENYAPQFQTDPHFQRGFELLERYVSIPGIFDGIEEPGHTMHWNAHHFLTEMNVAMQIQYNMVPHLGNVADDIGLDWDVATFPKFDEDADLLYPMDHSGRLAVTDISEHKEEAFEVIEYILSTEFQSFLAARGDMPAIDDPEVIEAYGSNFDGLEDKNITTALFEPSHAIGPTNMDELTAAADVGGVVFEAIERFASGEIDVATILREMDEEAEIRIQEGRERLGQ